ncbi:hypothetical protein [Enterocloster clostridioformis]|uniref:hypothetical protein n=1 Tax=Enterocloster clostridioformis TaxID=1531 RepID=UPI0032BFCF1C
MYNMKIEFSKKELNEVMEEMEQAQEKIFECWKRLESLGVAVVRESSQSNERSEALKETGSSGESHKGEWQKCGDVLALARAMEILDRAKTGVF